MKGNAQGQEQGEFSFDRWLKSDNTISLKFLKENYGEKYSNFDLIPADI